MKRGFPKAILAFITPAVLLTLAGFLIAFQFVDPAPPREITIATGQSSGTYYEMGMQYRQILARDGVTLNIKETTGSVENIELLVDRQSGVDVIFMQGGTAAEAASTGLLSLGSLFYEPLWVFHRADLDVRHLGDLRGQRIAVGVEGSGTKALADRLLQLNSVDPGNSQILYVDARDAAERMQNGEIDAAFSVIAYRSGSEHPMVLNPDIRLMSFARAEAYAKRLHYLSVLKLPQGTFNFTYNLPEEDTYLLAPTAQLVVREDFHPALIDLLLNAAKEVGSPGGVFERRGDFPAPRHLDFPLSSDAERYYQSGPQLLQRILPFWLANLVDRMKIMLLPLIALLFPLVKLLPPFYSWRMRSRIYRWYDQLMDIDYEILQNGIPSNKAAFLSRLNAIEKNVSQISVPLGFSRELFDMRVHIEMLRQKLSGNSESDRE